jgi:lysophospholipase L1-like esterase
MRSIARKLALVALAVLVAFALLEVGFRAVRFATSFTARPRLMYGSHHLYIGHPYTRTALRPGAVFNSRTEGVRVNSLGWRGPEVARPKPAGTLRLFALGGSTVFGFAMRRDEDAWPAQLEAVLRARHVGRTLEVVNGGVPGATTADALIRLELLATEIEPDVAILYEGINDALNNAPAPGQVFRHDYTHRLIGYCRPWWDHSVALTWAAHRLHDLGPGPPVVGDVNAEGIATFRRNARLFVVVARALGVTPVLATQAHVFDARSRPHGNHAPGLTARILAAQDAALHEVAAQEGAAIVDVRAALAGVDRATCFIDDAHLTVAGNRRVAEVLADGLTPVIVGAH